jgi:hypothetical protein
MKSQDFPTPVLDERLANCPQWYLMPPKGFNMRIRDDALRCVVFIGIEISGDFGKKIKWCGTGFFVSRKSDKFSGSFVYLVTAKHVLIEIGKNDFFIRANTKDKKSHTLKAEAGLNWFNHETSDVALYPLVLHESVFNELDYSALPVEMFVTDESIEKEGIGPVCLEKR